MIFDGTIAVNAPAPTVWDFLLDPKNLAECMPGIEQVTPIDDHTFDGVIVASVGPISGKFSFRASIVESRPPTELAAHVDGTDSVTRSTLNAEMAMQLHAPAQDRTELGYHATVNVKGRLAILGDMILRATATLIIDEFGKRLRQHLEGVK